ncbi:MAG: hypothetical protein GEU99_24875 [Luteitalea sp.]|nr:hypothetical protein [Luteitalea sp.]
MRPHTTAVMAAVVLSVAAVCTDPASRPSWSDLPAAVQRRLAAEGIDRSGLAAALERIEAETASRLRDGEWEALVYYALQSRRFTSLPSIEPALSAKAHHEQRAVPTNARARVEALAQIFSPATVADERLDYFTRLVADDPRVTPRGIAPVLIAEYQRVMRFLYEKEFVTPRETSGAATQARPALYQRRGHSTDTAVEAGYAVHQALGVIQSLNPAARVRRVLVIGPGLTLAPRTGFVEEIPPQSYQPYAVLDDMLSLGLTELAHARIDCVDISPRVVSYLERQRTAEDSPPLLLLSVVPDAPPAPFTPEYRMYFERWGRAVGTAVATPALPRRLADHLRRSMRLSPATRARVHATRANIVTERLDGPPYDLVIATNVLTYLDDVQVLLAVANVASLLAPGGHFVHNETRETLIEAADEVGLPTTHTRTVAFTQPSSNSTPLYDRIWIHRRRRG